MYNKYIYTLGNRIAKARLITVQEAVSLGCTTSNKSCPIWMYNYLVRSPEYGGTVGGPSGAFGYLSSSADVSRSDFVWHVYYSGNVTNTLVYYDAVGARSVVEVSK